MLASPQRLRRTHYCVGESGPFIGSGTLTEVFDLLLWLSIFSPPCFSKAPEKNSTWGVGDAGGAFFCFFLDGSLSLLESSTLSNFLLLESRVSVETVEEIIVESVVVVVAMVVVVVIVVVASLSHDTSVAG
jgi:hypothetical protein